MPGPSNGVKRFRLNLRKQPTVDRRWLEDRRVILEFNRSLTLIADPNALMASIAARIRELFGADRVVILHALSEGEMFTVAFSSGCDAEQLKSIRFAQHDRLPKWLLTNETAMVVGQDAGVFNYLSAAEREMLSSLNVRICLPLIALNRLTGLILVSSTKADWRLNAEDLSLLQMLTSQASIAFENAYLYQQQRDRLRRLYRAEQLAATGQLAASVAYEIRNPLTGIRSTVQYLLNDFDETNPKRRLIEGVMAEVDRIDRTVDGLLSLTRRAPFKPDRIALGQLIKQSLLLIETKARNQNVEISRPESAEEICVMGDASQLNQLFLNLIMNALQAMPKGGRLDVRLGRRSDPSGGANKKEWAEILVIDNGCGIPAENLEKISDPFFTTKQGGTGLGLSISHSVAHHHGGNIEISSREDEGTRVAVKLPLLP